MPDDILSREAEIKRGLAVCAGSNICTGKCPYKGLRDEPFPRCAEVMKVDALALIEAQSEKIAYLTYAYQAEHEALLRICKELAALERTLERTRASLCEACHFKAKTLGVRMDCEHCPDRPKEGVPEWGDG